MKNKIYLVAIAMFSLAIVSSCSMEKRLHNTGYHITWNQNWKNQNKQLSEKQLTETNSTIEVANTPVQSTNLGQSTHSNTNSTKTNASLITASIPNEKTTIDVQKQEVATTDNQAHFEKKVQEKVNYSTAKNNIQQMKAATQKNNQTSNAGGSGSFSGGMLVLMVILCLLPPLNLIPVYLHDGSLTMNFWLTLILDVLFVLPGIIFSLLVIFDVVSL